MRNKKFPPDALGEPSTRRESSWGFEILRGLGASVLDTVIRRGTMCPMPKTLTAIRLEPKQLAELEKIAKRDDRAVSYLIRKAIDEFIRREKRK